MKAEEAAIAALVRTAKVPGWGLALGIFYTHPMQEEELMRLGHRVDNLLESWHPSKSLFSNHCVIRWWEVVIWMIEFMTLLVLVVTDVKCCKYYHNTVCNLEVFSFVRPLSVPSVQSTSSVQSTWRPGWDSLTCKMLAMVGGHNKQCKMHCGGRSFPQ